MRLIAAVLLLLVIVIAVIGWRATTHHDPCPKNDPFAQCFDR
jgi:hypothetical protein